MPEAGLPENSDPKPAAEAAENVLTTAPSEPAPAGSRGDGFAEQYCRVAVDAGVAAKLSEERRKAEALKKDIETKLTELENATNELKKWLQLRNDFRNQATDNLVSVYAQMDPEAAAQRLTVIAEPVAAAILLKLPPKAASAVLGEMRPDMAGKITSFMAGAAEVRAKQNEGSGQTQ